MEEKRRQVNQQRHRLSIDNREYMEISGVLHVDSFDDEEILLETELGLLAVRGEELHIKHLNLEEGELNIEGFILELAYSEERGTQGLRGKGKGLLERLFR
ncbi:MAG: sporulation protein YabP [Candidatus Syntrophonatronum acetioxidans]|uniref:Sporulation protein YabP n=1 Tax=Candidatus Syntrophonatronum acetioxidans TaxID=1795816 RepID=A0A424YJ22_9FIRM|nr:MAG: sporulation protein YabP [Candidatus Syntrophonatronum acetioxidans]